MGDNYKPGIKTDFIIVKYFWHSIFVKKLVEVSFNWRVLEFKLWRFHNFLAPLWNDLRQKNWVFRHKSIISFGGTLGTFNNYGDQILPNFDPLPTPSSGQLCTFYMMPTLCHVTQHGLYINPHSTLLVHVIIEWPLLKSEYVVVMSAIMHKLLSVNINKFWSDRYQF